LGKIGVRTMDEEQSKYTPRELAPEEGKLLDFFRNELEYGEATVTVRRGLPVFVRVAMREVKLD